MFSGPEETGNYVFDCFEFWIEEADILQPWNHFVVLPSLKQVGIKAEDSSEISVGSSPSSVGTRINLQEILPPLHHQWNESSAEGNGVLHPGVWESNRKPHFQGNEGVSDFSCININYGFYTFTQIEEKCFEGLPNHRSTRTRKTITTQEESGNTRVLSLGHQGYSSHRHRLGDQLEETGSPEPSRIAFGSGRHLPLRPQRLLRSRLRLEAARERRGEGDRFQEWYLRASWPYGCDEEEDGGRV